MAVFYRGRHRSALCILSLLGMGLSSASYAGSIYDNPYLLGDWGGERTRLADKGIDFDFSYTNEAAHNFSGGDDRLTRSTGQIEAGVTMNLEKLWGLKGTTFSFIMTDRNGRSLDSDANLGTSQQTQEIYGRGQTVWLTKLVLEKSFDNDRFEVAVGRDSEGGDFDLANCDFINLSFCGSQGPNLYGSYWMSWPGSVWMARAKWNMTSTTYLKTGVYQQNPTYYDATWERHSGWTPMSPHGTDGVVLPLEFGWTPTIDGYSGSYRVGVMYNTGGMPDLTTDVNGNNLGVTGATARQSGESYNAWVAFSQQVTGTNGQEGLTVGLRAVAGDRKTSMLDRQITAQAEYANPFHQAGSKVGIAFGATHTSSREAEYQEAYNAYHPDDASPVGYSYEYVTEVYYSFKPLKSVTLQPDLQYIQHPGGSNANGNVFVAALRSVINF